MLKVSVKYNQRATIIESSGWVLSDKNHLILQVPKINCVYCCSKVWYKSEKSNEGFAAPARNVHLKKRIIRTPAIIQRALEVKVPGVLKIQDSWSKNCLQLQMLGKSLKKRILEEEEDLRYKSYLSLPSHLVQYWLLNYVDVFWSKEFCPPNNPDLKPLDFCAWSVIERVTNKFTTKRCLIESHFCSSIHQYGPYHFTACLRTLETQTGGSHSSMARICWVNVFSMTLQKNWYTFPFLK